MVKIEEAIEELFRAKINEQAVSIEKVHFYKTDRSVDPRRESPLKYFAGTVPVLISAPHAVRHVRQKKIKKSDEFTGSIAYLLNQVAGCHSLAVAKLYGGDPNVDESCIYKSYLKEICLQNKIKLVIDLHGAAREHDFDVDLGTNKGKSLLGRDKLLEQISEAFIQAGLNKVSYNYFPAATPNNITNFVARELAIPAVQVEVNRKYRVPAQNPRGFCRLIAVLMELIKIIR